MSTAKKGKADIKTFQVRGGQEVPGGLSSRSVDRAERQFALYTVERDGSARQAQGALFDVDSASRC